MLTIKRTPVRNGPVYNMYDTVGMGGGDTVKKNDMNRYRKLLLHFSRNCIYFWLHIFNISVDHTINGYSGGNRR